MYPVGISDPSRGCTANWKTKACLVVFASGWLALVTSALSAQEAVDQDKAVAEADQQPAAAEAVNADAAEAEAATNERERTQSTDAEELAAIEKNAQSATSKPESQEAKQVCRRIEVTGTHFTRRECKTVEQWAAMDSGQSARGGASSRRSKPVDCHTGPRAWAGYRARPSFRAPEPGRPLIRRGLQPVVRRRHGKSLRQGLAAAQLKSARTAFPSRSWSDRCLITRDHVHVVVRIVLVCIDTVVLKDIDTSRLTRPPARDLTTVLRCPLPPASRHRDRAPLKDGGWE